MHRGGDRSCGQRHEVAACQRILPSRLLQQHTWLNLCFLRLCGESARQSLRGCCLLALSAGLAWFRRARLSFPSVPAPARMPARPPVSGHHTHARGVCWRGCLSVLRPLPRPDTGAPQSAAPSATERDHHWEGRSTVDGGVNNEKESTDQAWASNQRTDLSHDRAQLLSAAVLVGACQLEAG
jgi:hypothetical protein